MWLSEERPLGLDSLVGEGVNLAAFPPPTLTTTWVKLVFSVYLKKDDSVGVFDDRAGVRGEEVLHFLVFQRLELRGGVGAGDHGRDLLTAVGPVVCKNQQTSQIHK